jgi:hypothetical protein
MTPSLHTTGSLNGAQEMGQQKDYIAPNGHHFHIKKEACEFAGIDLQRKKVTQMKSRYSPDVLHALTNLSENPTKKEKEQVIEACNGKLKMSQVTTFIYNCRFRERLSGKENVSNV